MTPQAGSPSSRTPDSRRLDFHHWLASRGMNPSRRRPPGRTATLLMDYRAYLVKKVGEENAGEWFEKYAPRPEPAPAGSAETS